MINQSKANSLNHGLRTPREGFFSKIRNSWALADKLGLKHITPKYFQNKILAVKNLGNSVHTSVFGGLNHWTTKILEK